MCPFSNGSLLSPDEQNNDEQEEYDLDASAMEDKIKRDVEELIHKSHRKDAEDKQNIDGQKEIIFYDKNFLSQGILQQHFINSILARNF